MVLHFHLTDARWSAATAWSGPNTADPLTLNQLTEFLAATGCPVKVQPVLDPAAAAPIDGYEISPRLRARSDTAQIADVFPFGTCTQPQHGPRPHPALPADGLGRAAGPDPARQPRPDGPAPATAPSPTAAGETPTRTGLLRAPLTAGYVYLVTNQGTLALGRTEFSSAVWAAGEPGPLTATA